MCVVVDDGADGGVMRFSCRVLYSSFHHLECSRRTSVDLNVLDNVSTPPKQKFEAGKRPALPSRSRSFQKDAPQQKQDPVEEAEQQEVSQAHEAVVLVDLQAWQARGLATATHRGDSRSLMVGAVLLALLFLWPVALMAWVEPGQH